MAQQTTNRASSLDRLSKALNPKSKPADEHVWGTVESTNADGSYQVRINASGSSTRCAACCTAASGDRVLVAILADGKCAAVGRLGGSGGGIEQATFYDSSTTIVTESIQGWAVVKLDECRAKTDGFDAVATFEDGVLTFLQSGCYEVTANAFWHGMTGQCGIGLWNGDTEEWSAFTSGPTIDSVCIPPVTLRVNAGETRTLKQFVHSGAQTRHSCYAWLTVSYFGLGGTPSGGGGGSEGGGISTETDPTVPSWAKQPNPPTYTAEDVGALPANTKIPAKVSELENDAGYLNAVPCYKPGDSAKVYYYGAGFVTSGAKSLRMTLPLDKPVTATGAKLAGVMTLRQEGNYIFGDSSEQVSISSLSQTFKGFSPCGAAFMVEKSSAFSNAVNNHAVGILFDGTITFS